MNVDNIKYAIEVMKKAENLFMGDFQCAPDKCEDDRNYDINEFREAETIDQLHTCGNRACFIGYLCLTDVWKQFFGGMGKVLKFDTDGSILYADIEDIYTSNALSEFLDIDRELADALIYGDYDDKDFYPVNFEDVTPEHVIEKLNLILKGELI